MRFLIFALLAVGSMALAISEEEYQYQFAKYQVTFNKTYTRAEFSKRYQVFKTNYDLITSHNLEKHAWTLAVNEYADMSWEEFKAQKLGYKKIVTTLPRETVNPAGLFTAPASVDWTTKGAVTAVKNQGQCGSCWAFSTTGSIEGAVAIAKGRLTSLSEQQLVDCSGSFGNEGCNGGLMDDAFQYVISNKGLCAESAYPYTAADGTCQTSCTSVSTISSYKDVTSNNLDALKAAVALQPVSVAIEADQSGFQFYSGGVFNGACGTALDHGVLAVGYGHDASSGLDFWKVKNSWGASWGESGYIRMVRTSGTGSGQCGIAMEPSYPVA
jgi:KDEL-tailed cysteine endopeptidase